MAGCMSTAPAAVTGSMSAAARPVNGRTGTTTEQRNRLIAAGDWAPLVDAGPVAVHIDGLIEAGMQRNHVAELAGVAASVVSKVLATGTGRNRVRRVRAETARRLLAVQRPAVDATGTRRRLQALVAIGWPPPLLDPQLGEGPGSVERLLHAEPGQRHHGRAGGAAVRTAMGQPTAATQRRGHARSG